MNKIAFLCNISSRWKKKESSILSAIRSFRIFESETFIVDRAKQDSTETHLSHILKKSFTHLAVVGGDGTLNRVVNRLARQHALGQIALAVFPFGTCNDFAKAISIKAGDLHASLRVLEEGSERPYRIGKVGRHFFLNNAGFGRRNPEKKRKSAVWDIQAMKPIHVQISWAGQTLEDKILMMVCANAPYFSNGLCFSKDSDPQDAMLEFFFVKKMSKLKLLTKLFLGKRGRPLSDGPNPESSIFRIQAAKLSIKTDSPIWVMADGEVVQDLSAVREASFQMAGRCRFLVPHAQ